ncbi:hypothetical protein ACFU53_11165 [Streptomyces sp. NPDC057474]|uniref:hypothetical protein n=1 Tax=Streptomyces sp. NPDC057474 TaxID=3346144 RepID=UPI0036891736
MRSSTPVKMYWTQQRNPNASQISWTLPGSRTSGHTRGFPRTNSMPVLDALKALPINDEDRTGYQRTKFRHWIDEDRDCGSQGR